MYTSVKNLIMTIMIRWSHYYFHTNSRGPTRGYSYFTVAPASAFKIMSPLPLHTHWCGIVSWAGLTPLNKDLVPAQSLAHGAWRMAHDVQKCRILVVLLLDHVYFPFWPPLGFMLVGGSSPLHQEMALRESTSQYKESVGQHKKSVQQQVEGGGH